MENVIERRIRELELEVANKPSIKSRLGKAVQSSHRAANRETMNVQGAVFSWFVWVGLVVAILAVASLVNMKNPVTGFCFTALVIWVMWKVTRWFDKA